MSDHATVKIGEHTVPLIGVDQSATQERCGGCGRTIHLSEAVLTPTGMPVCTRCACYMVPGYSSTRPVEAPRANPSPVLPGSPTKEMLNQFAAIMETKFALHREKGGPDEWRKTPARQYVTRILDEVNELLAALDSEDPDKICHEAADVANFALIVADCARHQFPPKERP